MFVLPTHFLFLFQDTPFSSNVSLKALTSQGKRFDVACRMMRASLINDGKRTGNSMTAVFKEKIDSNSCIVLSIDGENITDENVKMQFGSELITAKYLLSLIKNHKGFTEEETITINTVDVKPETSFLDLVRSIKSNGSRIALFHESGDFVFKGANRKLSMENEKNVFEYVIIGNNQGFPPDVLENLLLLVDATFALGRKDIHDSGLLFSYLGSQVITLLNFFQN